MTDSDKLVNFVHVTLANLNKPNSFITTEKGNGFLISGWKILMGTAVFCGKVLAAKVNKIKKLKKIAF